MSFSAQGFGPQERLLNHLDFPGGRRNRKEMRWEFSLRLNGGKGPDNQGSMRDAFDGLQHYGGLDFTKFNKHGADLVKHMMLWDRFSRPRAWEALQHSFFHVDPKDTQIEPSFATLLQKPVHQVPLPEEDTFHFRDDDYLFDRNPTFRSFIGDHVPDWIADEPMDPEDMYWYGKEGMDYIYDGAMRRGLG